MWGATDDRYTELTQLGVSIHAPHVGCDMAAKRMIGDSTKFQFTHPMWGVTGASRRPAHVRDVSIHAPRVGRDI